MEDETALLEAHGHEVRRFTLHNDSIKQMNPWVVAARTIWNPASHRELHRIMQAERFEVMHCMNTFPLISPAAYYAAHKNRVAVVQTLPNYRLVCPGAYLMRDGRVCQDCLEQPVPWPAVRYGCYRQSRLGSAAVAGMLTVHRLIGTWGRMVNRYIALSQSGRETLILGGLPSGKVVVKPNFIEPVPGVGAGGGGYVVFVGRLSPEKGVQSMLDAWRGMDSPPPLKIVGDGPLGELVREAAGSNRAIEWLGWCKPDRVLEILGEAAALLMPSLWIEGFPKTLLESMAKGTPVLASRLGSMAEVIRPGVTGELFAAGDVDGIRWTVARFFQSPDSWPAMRAAIRADFLEHYTAEENYRMLISIYQDAIRDLHGEGDAGD